nr:uncharacterized protein LOC111420756 [Onthophagus taurus]
MRSFIILVNLIFLFEKISGDLTPPDQKENKSWLKKNWVQNDEALCTGPIGSVQNILIEVTDTEMKVSYTPPLGYENCDLDYKTVYYQQLNRAVFQETTNKYLNQSYNYWEGRALCKLILLDIIPIYNGIQGTGYSSNQLTVLEVKK